jgi:hypothetical protein
LGQCSGIAPNSRKVEGAQQVADQVESFGYDSIAIAGDVSKKSIVSGLGLGLSWHIHLCPLKLIVLALVFQDFRL